MGYLDGFGVTIKKLLGPGTETGRRVTTQYPEQTRPKPERFHGRHVLNRYDDGMEKCIGCELCAGVCPARCIYVRGADNDPDDPTSPGERFGFIYEINYLRCIHCDLCVEACPTEAITETKLFEFAFSNRADAIYTKDELVVDDEGRPQQLPWENWDGGFDAAADTSGWMRATSPSGDAEFAGIVAWAGELGYGVRAPEGGGTVVTEPIADLVEPVEQPEPDDAAAASSEPMAMVAGTRQAGTFDLIGEAAPGASRTPTLRGDRATPSESDTDTDSPERIDPGTDEDASTDSPDSGGAAAAARRAAGFFDAPGDDPDPTASSPLGRIRRRRGDKGADVSRAGSVEDTAAQDAAVVAELEDRFGSPSGDAASSPPVVGSADESDESDDESDTADADARSEAAPTSPEPEVSDESDVSNAGFFDAPDVPEPPQDRKGRRRRGGR